MLCAMSASPISRLSKDERRQLLDDLNYLNTAEIKAFCKRQSIPYTIAMESKNGSRCKTQEDDRKGVMLERIRHFLRTGKVLEETCFRAAVVCLEALPEQLTADDRLFYGQYEKRNRALMNLLKDLTNDHYKDGAVARILLREFWSRGQAPTFREFASAWLQASNEHKAPNPEWAFLSDRTRKTATADWKKMRARKAANVMKTLNRITGVR
jgi:hypothetical protein